MALCRFRSVLGLGVNESNFMLSMIMPELSDSSHPAINEARKNLTGDLIDAREQMHLII